MVERYNISMSFDKDEIYGYWVRQDDHAYAIRGKDDRIAQIETVLRNLMARLDSHFGGDPSNDWKEQEEARAVLTQAQRATK